MANVRSLSLSLACISISRQRDEQEQEQVQLQLATLLRNPLHCSYSESCKSPRTARAHEIIEFSSKCNQAKFCTPNAFLTKVEDELGRRCRMTTMSDDNVGCVACAVDAVAGNVINLQLVGGGNVAKNGGIK